MIEFVKILITSTAITTATTLSAEEPTSQVFDGNTLLQWCDDGENYEPDSLCFGYIIGSVSSLRVGAFAALREIYIATGKSIDVGELEKLSELGVNFCPPAGVTNRQIVDTVTKSLKEHPEWRHVDATGIILAAMREAYPCKY